MVPVWLQAVVLGVTLTMAGVFAWEGVRGVQEGDRELARRLLRAEVVDRDPVPFTLTSMDGTEVRLRDFQDKTVVINFWATWCPPCIEEFPSLRTLASRFRNNEDFVFLAIATDDTWAPVESFFADEAAPFTVLLDPGGTVARAYGTEKFPETYVVEDGRVVGYVIGPRSWDSWYADAYLSSFLDSPSRPATAWRAGPRAHPPNPSDQPRP
ncbi:MAG: TlpA family protein disulfide reductase [Myxococcota bacterium]